MAFAISVFALPASLGAQTLASAKPPAYPLAARVAGIDGPVVLKGTVSKEGRMLDINVLSGPPELQQAAIDAVRGWIYKPYRHFGHEIEVDTTVTVNFNMGTGAKKAEAQAKAREEMLANGEMLPTQNGSQPPNPKL
ncbi:energy transducer TonB [Granulicella tundricola]|uniref:energy transducer TonB n=1 Tax=Granulicella tundricola TaxID=940615 RepID=UPI0018DDF8E3|nr:energy transducer TonB [Granulicella tundricola]